MNTKEYANAKNITCKHIVKKVEPFSKFARFGDYSKHSQDCYAANRRMEKYNNLYLYVDSLNGNLEELKATIERYENSDMYYRDDRTRNEAQVLYRELCRLKQGKERVIWDFSCVDTDKEFYWIMHVDCTGNEIENLTI